MNNFNTPTSKITNSEIKLVAGVLAAALLIALFFVYALPSFYNNENIAQKNNTSAVINSLPSNSTELPVKAIVTPPEVNI